MIIRPDFFCLLKTKGSGTAVFVAKNSYFSFFNLFNMKSLLFFLLLIPVGSTAQKITDPVVYNDKIVEYQDQIGYAMVAMNEHIGTDESTLSSAEELRLDLLKIIVESISGIKKMQAFDGNDDMRKAGLALFQFYERAVATDYKEAISILYKEDLSEDDITVLEGIVVKITEDESEFDIAFEKAQTAFAKKHNIELEENELQELLNDEEE